MEKSTQEFGSSTLNSPTQTPKNLVYQDVLKQVREFQGKALLTSLSSPQVVGDYGRWQVKVVLLLWIPMFFCGTQFVTTDLMNMEPKVLFCKASATCTSYDTIFLPNSRSVCFTFLSHDCSKNSNSKGPRDNSIAVLVGIGRLVEVYLPYTKVSISTIIKDDMSCRNDHVA